MVIKKMNVHYPS